MAAQTSTGQPGVEDEVVERGDSRMTDTGSGEAGQMERTRRVEMFRVVRRDDVRPADPCLADAPLGQELHEAVREWGGQGEGQRVVGRTGRGRARGWAPVGRNVGEPAGVRSGRPARRELERDARNREENGRMCGRELE